MNINRGFSLVEALVYLAVLSIVLTLTAPSLSELIRNNEKALAINQMQGILNHARSTAVFQHRPTSVCSGINNCKASRLWRDPLLVFVDGNENGQVDTDEHVEYLAPLPDGYTWGWSSFRRLAHLTFEADGTTRASNGTFTLCFEGLPLQQVVISLSGRVRRQLPARDASCT